MTTAARTYSSFFQATHEHEKETQNVRVDRPIEGHMTDAEVYRYRQTGGQTDRQTDR